MAFLNCNSVTDSASRRVLGFRSSGFRRRPADAPGGRAALCPFQDLFLGPVFIRGATTTWGISEESLPRRKDSYGALIFPCTLFLISAFLFFSYLVIKKKKKTPQAILVGHHVRWSRKLNADTQRPSFTEHHVSRVLCLNSEITVERRSSLHFHSLFSLKRHERQVKFWISGHNLLKVQW